MAKTKDIDLSDLDPVGEDDLPPVTENAGEKSEGERESFRLLKSPIVLYRFLAGKPMLLAAAALLIGAAAAWGFLESPSWKRGNDPRSRPLAGPLSPEDSLRQEDLTRFYIPLPKDSENLVMVVDFSVVWDALAAVRYKKAEVSIRDRVYDSLSILASKDEEVKENTPDIEEAISNVLRETLRAEALSVKVKEVKVF